MTEKKKQTLKWNHGAYHDWEIWYLEIKIFLTEKLRHFLSLNK